MVLITQITQFQLRLRSIFGTQGNSSRANDR